MSGVGDCIKLFLKIIEAANFFRAQPMDSARSAGSQRDVNCQASVIAAKNIAAFGSSCKRMAYTL